ncbi:peptide-binding protein [Haloferula helveola]|uniref:Peptide-binding protein n=1 Tax=Haloferula helveola TaxID=490095 RepID=A0ABM7RGF3_9BACT|nr:peptide-binding protein [Haloferula helveola]
MRSLAVAAERVLAAKPGSEPVTVWIHGGRYPVTETVRFGKEFSGNADAPIRFRAVEGEVPVFDSGLAVGLSKALPVSESDGLERLAESVRGQVLSLKIDDKDARDALANPSVRCSIDGRTLSLAGYPNVGFGHIDRIVNPGAVYAEGRTLGPRPSWSIDKPVGGSFTLRDKDTAAWEREYETAKLATVTGYLANDWYLQSHPLASIKDGVLRLADSSRYGIKNNEKIPRRLKVTNLLCELDAPGEFYFDRADSRLFFIPFPGQERNGTLSIWGGPGLLEVDGASHLAFEGLVAEGVSTGKAVVSVSNSSHVVLAGCTVRNSTRPGVVIEGGNDCGLRSCDLYDLRHHLTLTGGDVRTLRPAGNFAVNCHFTQVSASDFYGRVQIRGVGQIFRNNLLHNFPGQVLVFGDCDHRIERNELFNIGFEEGDGGAIYSGASRWSWGNVLRHNFLHHLMCLPQAHPRGGIYPDDGDQGETIEGNVFYKAAHRAVLINGGAGHAVRDNLFLEGYIGIYNTEASAEKAYARIAKYESGELKRGDKDDQIWRTEQVVGKEGWNREPWRSRYPTFRKIMNQERMRFYPIECEYKGNRFSGNWRNIEHRVGGGENGVKDIGQVPFIRSTDNVDIRMSVFADPDALDFRVRRGAPPPAMPAIPFAKIGLYQDIYRARLPEKDGYRRAVRSRFDGKRSFDPKAKYDPRRINGEIYFNTGLLLRDMGGMLHGVPDSRRPHTELD